MAEMDRTPCRTPSEGKDGVTNIPSWKFDCIRVAILSELATGDCRWSDLTDRVRQRLTAEQLESMGSLGWHVVSVKLEMEVRGEIQRVQERGPQVLTLA